MGSEERKQTFDKVEEEKKFLMKTHSVIQDSLDRLGYPKEVYKLLKDSLRMFKVKIPVQMDDGSVEMFTGFRAQHNDAIGPTKGGVRFQPNLSESEVNALAIWMSIKAGVLNLPHGGSQGGIKCDPRNLSFRELEALSRGYIRAMGQLIGPTKDILTTDLYTNSQIMAWMMDEFSYIDAYKNSGSVTGKPIVLGGTQGRETAVAKGIMFCIQEAMYKKNFKLEGIKVIVQGFGKVGSYLAKILHDSGAKVVGISDAYGALYEPDGLDIDYLLDRRDSFGTVTKLFNQKITNQELLELDCDLLIPAAMDHQITKENAHKIKAEIIVEATENPMTEEAEAILVEENVLIVPYVLSASGDVAVSYLEWAQNHQRLYWTEKEIEEKLKQIMVQAFTSVYEIARTRRVNMRLAAHMVGVRKMAEAARFRGWV